LQDRQKIITELVTFAEQLNYLHNLYLPARLSSNLQRKHSRTTNKHLFKQSVDVGLHLPVVKHSETTVISVFAVKGVAIVFKFIKLLQIPGASSLAVVC